MFKLFFWGIISLFGVTYSIASLADNPNRISQLQNAQSQVQQANQSIQLYRLQEQQKLNTNIQKLQPKTSLANSIATPPVITPPPAAPTTQQSSPPPSYSSPNQPVENSSSQGVTGYSSEPQKQNNSNWQYGL